MTQLRQATRKANPDSAASETEGAPMARVLIAEDEDRLRRLIQMLLSDRGFELTLAENGKVAWTAISSAETPFDLVLTDVRMPEMDGMELLTKIRQMDPDLPVVMITAFASVEKAVEAMRAGATDYLTKPFEETQLHLAVDRALETAKMRRENERLRAEVSDLRRADSSPDSPIAQSEAMRHVLETARAVAATSSTVLITGESGTGKEVLTRYIHDHSPRSRGPFIAVNCAAIPENLFESELFGHEKGAFTGASDRRIGRFEQASGGTLFLDEIGELDLAVQAKVLRAIELRQIERLGGNRSIPCDIRVIAATHRDLAREVQEGRFRQDLFFRICVFPIHVPPLRERPADLPALVKHFVVRFCRSLGRPTPEIPPETLQQLMALPWPGNIRELQNAVERALILLRGTKLGPEYFSNGVGPYPACGVLFGGGPSFPLAISPISSFPGPSSSPGVGAPSPLFQPVPPVASGSAAEDLSRTGSAGDFQIPELGFDLESHERMLLEQALQRSGGNKSRTARMLGLSRATLRYRLEKFGLGKADEGEEADPEKGERQ